MQGQKMLSQIGCIQCYRLEWASWLSLFTDGKVNLIIPEAYTLWKWPLESSASEVRGPEPSSFPSPNLSHPQHVIWPSLAPAPHPWMHQFMPVTAVPRLYWLPNQILILHQPYSGGLALGRWGPEAQGWRRKMSQGKLYPSPISPQSNELGSRELQPSPTHLPVSHFSHSVMSDSLQAHEPQHSRPPCPSPTPGV